MGNGKNRAAKSPQELLDDFARTGQQAPFEEIVRRYAGMVFHVCRQVTKNNHDAEDATQAVFLTLAIQLKTGRVIKSVGPWLQQVAYRLAIDVRRAQKRRLFREEVHAKSNGNLELDGATQLGMAEMRQVVVDELNKLPAKYRLPLILHYFGGLSREELAKELKCKPTVLSVRLHRARQLLGERLSGRGVAIAGGVLAVATMEAVHLAVSESLVANTCRAATALAAGHELGPGIVSAQVLTLARGAARAVIFTKAKTAAIVLLMAGSAVAAGAQMMTKVTADLHLPSPGKLRDSITAPIRPSLPKLRVDAGTTEEPGGEAVRSADVLAAAPAGSAGLRPRIEIQAPPRAAQSFQLVREGPKYSVAWNSLWPGRSRTNATSSYAGPVRSEPVVGGGGFVPRNWTWQGSGGFASSRSVSPAWTVASQSDDKGAGAPARPVRPQREGPIVRREPVRGTLQSLPQGVPGLQKPFAPGQPPDGSVVDGARPAPVPRPFNWPLLYQPDDPGGLSAIWPSRGPEVAVVRQDITLGAFDPVSQRMGSPNTVTNGVGMGEPLLADADHSISLHLIPLADSSQSVSYAQTAGRVLGPAPAAYVAPTWHTSSKTLFGYGRPNLGVLDNNGQVTARGYGVDHELDLSSATIVCNSLDNQPVGGINGWYAQSHGKLLLPALPVDPATRTATWGEQADDLVIDLVNSVRATFNTKMPPETLNLSLVATDRTDLPGLPPGRTAIGMWHAEGGALRNVELTIRYDEYLAQSLACNERFLQLWGYDNGTWHELNSVQVDTQQNLISGRATSVSYFAVTTPEPGAMLVFAGAAMLLARRQRRGKR